MSKRCLLSGVHQQAEADQDNQQVDIGGLVPGFVHRVVDRLGLVAQNTVTHFYEGVTKIPTDKSLNRFKQDQLNPNRRSMDSCPLLRRFLFLPASGVVLSSVIQSDLALLQSRPWAPRLANIRGWMFRCQIWHSLTSCLKSQIATNTKFLTLLLSVVM